MPERTKELDLISSLEKDKFEAFFVENLKELTYGIKCRKFFIKNKNFVFTERGDGVTIYMRRRHHDTCDDVRISPTASNAQVIFDEKKLGNS
ncbi:hypothetical protein Tco_1449237 [Tanacetum coccineum]